MKRFLTVTGGVLAGIMGGALVWRWASRRWELPTPYWLAWFFEMPLIEEAGGTSLTLDRIGVQPGDICLDVGSGPGRMTIPAARRVGQEGKIVSLDIQPAMLERLMERVSQADLLNIQPLLADISTEVNLPDGSFDRAWLVTVLGEIPDQAAALRQIYRVLKPGGILSVSEVLPDPHYQRRKHVVELGEQAGFTPVEYWGTGLRYTQNFLKPGEMRSAE